MLLEEQAECFFLGADNKGQIRIQARQLEEAIEDIDLCGVTHGESRL